MLDEGVYTTVSEIGDAENISKSWARSCSERQSNRSGGGGMSGQTIPSRDISVADVFKDFYAIPDAMISAGTTHSPAASG
jgi:hypothetical protein